MESSDRSSIEDSMWETSDEMPSRPSFLANDRASKISVAIVSRPLLAHVDGMGATECLVRNEEDARVMVNGRTFAYDHVHGPESSPEHVFAGCIRDRLLPRLTGGFNVTMIAYGQTGSGKTHTMGSGSGASSQPGLIQHTVAHLFGTLPPQTACWVSFIQVYCEEVHDLLEIDGATGGPMSLQHRARALPVPRKERVHSPEEVAAVLSRGSSSRSTGATNLNADSSRSHAIVTFEFALPVGESSEVVVPKLHFVDLAGSERSKRAGTSGKRLEEGNSINKGLHALGNVVSALEKGAPHVPYRDAIITRLLEDSLGGNSQTLVVACVSPSEADREETLNTLQYAARMRQILNKPLKAVTGAADSALLSRWKLLQAERKRLRAEELALRDKLRAHPSAVGVDEEGAAAAELPLVREELEGVRGELAAAEARLAEVEPAALRAPCSALAARAVHAVVVGAMAAELKELRTQVAAQAAAHAAAARASDARAESLEADLSAAVAQLSSRDVELISVQAQLAAANEELAAAREQLAAREAAPSTGHATGEVAELSVEDSDTEAPSGPLRSSRKRGTIELLEGALEDARPRRQKGRIALPAIPDGATAAHGAEDEAHVTEEGLRAVRAAAEAVTVAEAEALEAIGESAHGVGEAAHGDKRKRGRGSRVPAHAAEEQRGEAVGKSAFGSRLPRDGRSSIYGYASQPATFSLPPSSHI